MQNRIYLRDKLSQGIQELNFLSQQLASQQVRLSFRGVHSIAKVDMQAIFQHLPRNWDHSNFDNVFDIESLENEQLENDLFLSIEQWKRGENIYETSFGSPNLSSSPQSSVKRHSRTKLAIGLISVILLGGISFKVQHFLSSYRFSQSTLVIGAVNSKEQYTLLQKYLQNKLVPPSFWQYVLGKKIEVIIDAASDSETPYPQAIGAFKDQKWDIGFAYSPVVSMSAVDSGYKTIAIMFPDSPSYQASIFVKSDSPIQSFDKISENHTIALGDFFSASKFYVPLYELYGKRLKVIPNVSTQEIFDLVRSGKVDIGVGVINDLESQQDLRVIKQSRSIPGSGVYISPNLNEQDGNSIKKALLNAPPEIRSRDHSNYGIGDEPNFDHFRDIIQRVREITTCSDFTRNPVNFFCNDQIQVFTVEGRVNGIEKDVDDYLLRIFQYDGHVCRIQASNKLLAEVESYNTAFDLQGYYLTASVGVPQGTKCNNDTIIRVFQPNQIEFTKQVRK